MFRRALLPLEVAARERRQGDRGDDREVRDRPEPDGRAADVCAAEGPELEDEPRRPARVRGDLAERILVERLDGDHVGGDLRRALKRVRAEGVPDRAEEAGDEAGA